MRISRRNFLRANGALLSLPFLHSLAGAAEKASIVAKPSQKLVIVYIPNGIVRRTFFPGEEDAELPSFVGGFDADKTKNERRFKHTPGIYPLAALRRWPNEPLAWVVAREPHSVTCCNRYVVITM